MNIIAVDDAVPMLAQAEDAIAKALPGCNLAGFTSPRKAIEYAKSTPVDIAFLDIDMGSMNGLILAKHLKEIRGETNIIFITGYREYAVDAFAVAASGYVLKPATPEAILKALEHLRNPVEPELDTHRVKIKCFGSFTVYVDGKPFEFPHSKAKELFALLVHRNGGAVTNAEIASILWEDKPYGSTLQAYTRTVYSKLIKSLKELGINNIIRKSYNRLSLDPDKVQCDYYEYIKGNVNALNTYVGEYMNEYSWAEFTAAYLERKTK